MVLRFAAQARPYILATHLQSHHLAVTNLGQGDGAEVIAVPAGCDHGQLHYLGSGALKCIHERHRKAVIDDGSSTEH